MRNTLLATAMGTFTAMTTLQAQTQQPNILIILTDDQQSDAIAALGNPDVYTPNMDKLVKRGFTMTNTFTNGSLTGALSMPSRAMLMTGVGIFDVKQDGRYIPEEQITMPQHFRDNGYRTFGTGKWHNCFASFNRSFEEGDNIFFGGMHTYQSNGHFAPRLHHYDKEGNYKQPFIGDCFSSEMFADAAVKFLNSTANDDRPFFAYVAFTSPHDPRTPPPGYGQKYMSDTLHLPVNYSDMPPYDTGDLDIRDEVIRPFPRTQKMVKEEMALYYGMVSEVDTQIGRVLEALEKSGQLENTIIVFAADNGLAVGQHGLLGKQNLYNHSVRVPLVMVGKGIKQGAQNSSGCYLYDVYPTICETAGLPVPECVKGKSFQPLLNGKNKKHRDLISLNYSNLIRGIVKDNFKLIAYNVKGKNYYELYDLTSDPKETKNLINDAKYVARVAQLKQVMIDESKKNGDFCDLDQPQWNCPTKLSWDDALKVNP